MGVRISSKCSTCYYHLLLSQELGLDTDCFGRLMQQAMWQKLSVHFVMENISKHLYIITECRVIQPFWSPSMSHAKIRSYIVSSDVEGIFISYYKLGM